LSPLLSRSSRFAARSPSSPRSTLRAFSPLLTAIGILGAGAAMILILRLLGEIWMTNLRIQDRLAIMIEQNKEARR
jgi:hypothetical protein